VCRHALKIPLAVKEAKFVLEWFARVKPFAEVLPAGVVCEVFLLTAIPCWCVLRCVARLLPIFVPYEYQDICKTFHVAWFGVWAVI